jgi:hypothetical protein
MKTFIETLIATVLWPLFLLIRVTIVLSLFFLYFTALFTAWIAKPLTTRFRHQPRFRTKWKHRRRKCAPATENRYLHCCYDPVDVDTAFLHQDLVLSAILLYTGPAYWHLKKLCQRYSQATPHKPVQQIQGTLYGLRRKAFSLGRLFTYLSCRIWPPSETKRRQTTALNRKLRKALSQAIRYARSTSRVTPTRNAMTAMASSNANARQAPRHVNFDTDSYEILFDNGASHHIWNRRRDFVDYRPLTEHEKTTEVILGIAGSALPLGIGTVKVTLDDDTGERHDLLLENVRHLPNSPICIFVPQDFAQQRQSEGDTVAHCDTRHDGLFLEWTVADSTVASKFIPLSASNVGITRNSPGYTQFNAYASIFCNFCQSVACPATVSDNEGDSDDEFASNLKTTCRELEFLSTTPSLQNLLLNLLKQRTLRQPNHQFQGPKQQRPKQ